LECTTFTPIAKIFHDVNPQKLLQKQTSKSIFSVHEHNPKEIIPEHNANKKAMA